MPWEAWHLVAAVSVSREAWRLVGAVSVSWEAWQVVAAMGGMHSSQASKLICVQLGANFQGAVRPLAVQSGRQAGLQVSF